MIKLLLIFKRDIFREGLARLLQDSEDIEIVGICSGNDDAIEKAKECLPDVVLMDTELKEGNAVELTSHLCQILPKIKIMLFSIDAEGTRLIPALKAGALGYVTKEITAEDLVKAISLVIDDEIVIGAAIAKELLDGFISLDQYREQTEKHVKGLTPREKEVLTLAAKGASNKEIAHELSISIHTVQTHLSNTFGKLGVSSRTEAAILALRKGWLTLDELC